MGNVLSLAVLTSDHPTRVIGGFYNWFARNVLFVPGWVCDRDRVAYPSLKGHQDWRDMLCTIAVHASSVFVLPPSRTTSSRAP